jgi:hypothetical protein
MGHKPTHHNLESTLGSSPWVIKPIFKRKLGADGQTKIRVTPILRNSAFELTCVSISDVSYKHFRSTSAFLLDDPTGVEGRMYGTNQVP